MNNELAQIIREEIFKSIHLIADAKIRTADYTSFLISTISYIDSQDPYHYKVKYQGNTDIDVYSIGGQVYKLSDSVIVLYSNSDFNKKKLILSTSNLTTPTFVTTSTTSTGVSTVSILNVTGMGTGVSTFLITPSSANLRTAVTDETGTGKLVFNTAPTMTNVKLIDQTIVTSDAAATPFTTTRVATSIIPNFQILGTTGNFASGLIARFDNSINAARLFFSKSRSTSINGHTIVQDGDNIGEISFGGSNGTTIAEAARITVMVDGTPSSTAMPGSFSFFVSPTTSSTPAVKFQIGSGGTITFNSYTNAGYIKNDSSGVLSSGTSVPIADISGFATGITTFLTTPSSANLAAAVTDETGSGLLVFNNGPTFIAPTLGTPASATLTNCVGLPIATGITGMAAGITTFLITPTSANLASAITNETGSGLLVFNTSATISAVKLINTALVTSDTAATAFTTTRIATSFVPDFQIIGTGSNPSSALIGRFDNTTSAARLFFSKSRGTSVDSHAVVLNGDDIGEISFGASDGTNIAEAARIRAEVGGAPGTSIMPGNLSFLVSPTTSSTPAVQFKISADGTITFNSYTTAGYLKNNVAGVISSSTSVPVGDISGLGTGISTFLGTPSSANLASAVTDETGSGLLVFNNGPTFIAPTLGTPTSGLLTNCNGLPIATGVSGLASGITTFLTTPSSVNLASAVTDETGSGSLVFATSPTISGPTITGQIQLDLGTALAPSLTNSGLSTGIFYPGTGSFAVSTAGLEVLRMLNSQRLLIGSTANFVTRLGSTAISTKFQLAATDDEAALQVNRFSADTSAPRIHFNKSRNATIGSHTAVIADDVLGDIVFLGSDGTRMVEGARIKAEVDGGVGSTDMPGRLVFLTTLDGAQTPTERMRIDNNGKVMINQTTALTTSANLTPTLQIVNSTSIQQYLQKTGADANPAAIYFTKTRTTGSGAYTTTLSADDQIAAIIAEGANGTALQRAGSIRMHASAAFTAGGSPGYITFYTTPNGSTTESERIRIDNAGNLGVGTTNPGKTLHVSGGMRNTNRNAASTQTALHINTTTGDIAETASSRRFKRNIQDYNKGLETLIQMRSVSFQFLEDDLPNTGLIAEEVHDLGLPEFIRYDADNAPYSIPYDNLSALFVNAIKDLKKQNDLQQQEIDLLKSQISMLLENK